MPTTPEENGESAVELVKRYTKDSRFYKRSQDPKDDTHYPSVTTILKGVKVENFLDEWKLDQVERIGVLGLRIQTFLAMEAGTVVHKAIEKYHMGEQLDAGDYTLEEWICLNNFVKWSQTRNPTVIEAEQAVYSDKMRYAGQVDAVMEMDVDGERKKFIVDFKKGKDVYDDYLLQGAAYLKAYEETHETKVDGFIILALNNPRTKIGYKETMVTSSLDIDHYYDGFLRRKMVWDWENPNAGPKAVFLPKTISK